MLKLRGVEGGWGGCFCEGVWSGRGHNSFLDKCFSPAVRWLSICLSKVLAGRHGHGRLQRGSGPGLHHAGVRKHASAAAGHRWVCIYASVPMNFETSTDLKLWSGARFDKRGVIWPSPACRRTMVVYHPETLEPWDSCSVIQACFSLKRQKNDDTAPVTGRFHSA